MFICELSHLQVSIITCIEYLIMKKLWSVCICILITEASVLKSIVCWKKKNFFKDIWSRTIYLWPLSCDPRKRNSSLNLTCTAHKSRTILLNKNLWFKKCCPEFKCTYTYLIVNLGKTSPILGTENNPGIIPRALE